jgi:phosphoglycolate phosphatase-like HAD superfamily hydrolase
VNVAIATGDWHSTITFKLSAAGLDVTRFPMATSSEARERSEIIKLAAQRSGRSLADVVYVGDGVWDLLACRKLGVRFVGTGTRTQQLKEVGAKHIIEDFTDSACLNTLRRAMQEMVATHV